MVIPKLEHVRVAIFILANPDNPYFDSFYNNSTEMLPLNLAPIRNPRNESENPEMSNKKCIVYYRAILQYEERWNDYDGRHDDRFLNIETLLDRQRLYYLLTLHPVEWSVVTVVPHCEYCRVSE